MIVRSTENDLAPASAADAAATPEGQPGSTEILDVPNDVVTVTLNGPVAVIRMLDEASGNGLTPEFATQLASGLAAAENCPDARAIVLTGLPNIFSSGATREAMRQVVLGQRNVTATDRIVRGPALSNLPVVAAIRGHAIGGGLLLGLYCDIAVLSERSFYSVPFVQFGITPAQGATYIIKKRFGDFLGTEMLLTGRRYQGEELRRCGASARIVHHDQVEREATSVAADLAAIPLPALRTLKTHLASQDIAGSDEAMHDESDMLHSSIGVPDVISRVRDQWQQVPATGHTRQR